ncbi:MAG: hypothetical protein JW829_18205, partial [Pirellulales bacterium]|nr:hypothetical protein [Pirellulales bacterium]
TDLSAMTVPEAYAHGDMNQDRANNFADLVLFRDIYDSLYGPGAFNALVASVPEPTGIHLFLLGGLALVLAGYKKGFQRMWRRGGQDRSILQLPRCGKMPQPQNCVHPSRTGVLRPLLGPRMIGFVAGFLGVLLIPAQAPAQLLTATNNNSLDANDVYQLNLLGLADGALVNIDRTHVFYNLPLELQGIDYVLTANDDKTATAAAPAFSVDLTFIEGTTLYLSIDSRVGDDNDDNGPTLGNGIMDWVLTQGWVDTGLTWYKENEYPDVPFHVYELTPAGTSHTFYEQNNGGTRNMYSIAGRGEGPISPTLLVNTDTGEITISNSTKLTWNLNYYEITSESGSLDPGAWNSLADQNLDSIGPGAGESWVEAGGSDSEILSEFFTLGASALAPDEMISLGFGYNPQGAQDIKFLFAIDGGTSLREGVVEYVTGGDIADFNADGDVDGADFLVWQIGFGTMSGATRAEGDANGDGAVNNADLSIWKSQFGMSGASAQGLTSTSVPEPGALDLIGLFMGGLLIVFLRQTKGKRAMDILRIRTIAGCWVIGILTQAALADYTLDRLYLMGDDDGVSANSAVSVTDDSAGVSLDHLWAYQVASGNSPIYVDTSSRPQADLNELGIRFDAVQEHYLDGPRLGLPDTSIAASIEDYAGISNRGFQLWVKPAVAGVGNLQQDIVMDTEQHGFGITADGNWFMQYGGNAYDSGITVTAGEWYHVMVVRPYGSSGSDSGARMYVNGIAVAAMSGDYTGTDQTNLAIGVRTYESFPVEPYHFFSGIVDDLEMFVLGTTTSDPPTVLGTFNLGEDNAYIATQLTGVAGDVNQDNLLNDSDIDAFVAGWKHKNLVNNIAVGDLNTITMGDLNWNGITELGDAFILHEALLEAGMGGLDFRLLSGVPEPASCLLLLVAMPAWIGMKRHGYL